MARADSTWKPRLRARASPDSQTVVLPMPASPSTNSAAGAPVTDSRNSSSAHSSAGRLAMFAVICEESQLPPRVVPFFKRSLGVARFDLGHRQHVESTIQLLQRQFVADQPPVDDGLADGLLLLERLLGHRRGLLVADRRIQRGDDRR